MCAMKTKDAITFYGTRKAMADMAAVSRQAAAKWGRVIPWRTAGWLEYLSSGCLKRDPACYTKYKRPKK